MLNNRSVPTEILLPHIINLNVADAAAWLNKAFGFIEHYRYLGADGQADGAQMRFGDAWVMLSRARPGRSSPAHAGLWTQMLTIFVEDLDAHFERAKSAGAVIIEDLHETIYGERQYCAEDIELHRWLFSRHAPDVSPEEWGAKLAK
jgi:uncharacterized glyoxalase superfamily protein PhnB